MCEDVGFKTIELVDLGNLAFGLELQKN